MGNKTENMINLAFVAPGHICFRSSRISVIKNMFPTRDFVAKGTQNMKFSRV